MCPPFARIIVSQLSLLLPFGDHGCYSDKLYLPFMGSAEERFCHLLLDPSQSFAKTECCGLTAYGRTTSFIPKERICA